MLITFFLQEVQSSTILRPHLRFAGTGFAPITTIVIRSRSVVSFTYSLYRTSIITGPKSSTMRYRSAGANELDNADEDTAAAADTDADALIAKATAPVPHYMRTLLSHTIK